MPAPLEEPDCERCDGSGYDPDPATLPNWCYEGMCRECEGHGKKIPEKSPDEVFP